jgi:hypothetical protein
MRREIIAGTTVNSILQPATANAFQKSYCFCNGTDFRFLTLDDFVTVADPMFGFDYDKPLSSKMTYEANGVQSLLNTIPVGGYTAALVNGSTARFVQVADPDNAAKQCWWLRLSSADADTAGTGAKRTEFATSATNYPGRKGQRILYGMNVRLPSWSTTTDMQAIQQIHGSQDIASGPPWFAHYIQGSTETIVLRYSAATVPTVGNTTLITVWTNTVPANTWRRIVVDTAHAYDGGGYCKVWVNDVLVVDYVGALGYVEPLFPSYPKAGIYHWTDSGNLWDATMPVREAHFKGPYFCNASVPSADLRQLLSVI